MIPEFNTAAELRAHYAALALRMGRAVKRPVVSRKVAAPPVEEIPPAEKDVIHLWRGYYLSKESYEAEVERFNEVLAAVCDAAKIPVSELTGPRRFRQLALARGVVYFLAKRLTDLSYPQISALMNRVGHRTTMDGAIHVYRYPKRYEPVLSQSLSRLGVEYSLVFRQENSTAENPNNSRPYIPQIKLPVQS